MNVRLLTLATVFTAFTAYTAVVVVNHGYTGFLELALAHAWGGQMFVDLVIALLLFTQWMVGDARERGLPLVPYVLAILTTGSVGALGYLLHRELKATETSPAAPSLT